MSEHESVWPLLRSQSEHDKPEAAPAERQTEATAGQMLRKAREVSGLHLVTLAAALKVSVKRIQKIEADDLQTEQDIVFTRALIGSICRHLKTDPRPILAALPQSRPVALADMHGEGLQTPFHAPGYAAAGWTNQLKRPAVGLVALLLVCTATVLFWPETSRKPDADPSSPTGAVTGGGSPQAQAITLTPVAIATVESVAPPVLAAPALTATPAPLPLAVMTPTVAMPALAGTAAHAVGAEAVVGLKARSNTWAEVLDAKANTLLRRTLQAGESVDIKGLAPLSVVLGRADQMDVQVQGRPMALTPYTKDNVARFEVRP
jgi:cytoskeleton protein RodZ